eukprot:s1232_g14.t1
MRCVYPWGFAENRSGSPFFNHIGSNLRSFPDAEHVYTAMLGELLAALSQRFFSKADCRRLFACSVSKELGNWRTGLEIRAGFKSNIWKVCAKTGTPHVHVSTCHVCFRLLSPCHYITTVCNFEMKPRPSWQLSSHLNAVATNVYDFNLLLAARVAAKQWRLALDMFNERSRSGRLIDTVSLNTCMRAGQNNWVFALLFLANTLAQRVQVDERTIGTLMTCSGQDGLWKTSEALFWNMFGLSLRANAICQSNLMSSQLSQHQWFWALAVWARMVHFDVEQDQTSRNIVLNAWCHGRWVQAGALLRDPIDAASFNTVACSRSFAWPQSESFLREMQQSRIHVGSVGAAATLFGPSRGWRKAFILFEELFGQTRSSIVTYTGLLEPRGCGSWMQSWTQAIALLTEITGSAIGVDQIFANALVSAMTHGHNPWQTGLTVLGPAQALSGLSFGQEMAASVLHRLSWAGALNVVSGLQARRSALDSACLNAAIDACNTCTWQLPLSLIAYMTALKIQTDQVGYAASAPSVLGEWIVGLVMLHAAQDQGIDVNEFMFSATQSACGKGMNWMLPLELLSPATPSCMSRPLNEVVFSATVSACGKCSKWAAALQGMFEMNFARLESGNVYLNTDAAGADSWRAIFQATMDMYPRNQEFAFQGLNLRSEAGSAVSTSLAMRYMWEQSLHLLQHFLDPAMKSESISACFASLIVACEHVENQLLLARSDDGTSSLVVLAQAAIWLTPRCSIWPSCCEDDFEGFEAMQASPHWFGGSCLAQLGDSFRSCHFRPSGSKFPQRRCSEFGLSSPTSSCYTWRSACSGYSALQVGREME